MYKLISTTTSQFTSNQNVTYSFS